MGIANARVNKTLMNLVDVFLMVVVSGIFCFHPYLEK